MTLIQKLKDAKKNCRLTTEELSSLTGVPCSTLNKIFSGNIEEPKFSVVVSLASALQIPVASLADEDPALALPPKEKELLLSYRSLDAHGREICRYLIEKEAERCASPALAESAFSVPEPCTAKSTSLPQMTRPKILPLKKSGSVRIRLFDLPASAGVGEPLDQESSTWITVSGTAGKAADFAVKVNGNSMEPLYTTGDILLVREGAEIQPGELGLFVADGEGYFKKFGGDRLISLNPDYADIPISHFSHFSCRGKIVGRIRHK